MSTLSVRLPDSLHKNIKKLSKKEQISINQFITNADWSIPIFTYVN